MGAHELNVLEDLLGGLEENGGMGGGPE